MTSVRAMGRRNAEWLRLSHPRLHALGMVARPSLPHRIGCPNWPIDRPARMYCRNCVFACARCSSSTRPIRDSFGAVRGDIQRTAGKPAVRSLATYAAVVCVALPRRCVSGRRYPRLRAASDRDRGRLACHRRPRRRHHPCRAPPRSLSPSPPPGLASPGSRPPRSLSLSALLPLPLSLPLRPSPRPRSSSPSRCWRWLCPALLPPSFSLRPPPGLLPLPPSSLCWPSFCLLLVSVLLLAGDGRCCHARPWAVTGSSSRRPVLFSRSGTAVWCVDGAALREFIHCGWPLREDRAVGLEAGMWDPQGRRAPVCIGRTPIRNGTVRRQR